MADKNIESKVQELIEKEITDLGYELYDVEYLKEGRDFYLRIYINSKNSQVLQVLDVFLGQLVEIGLAKVVEQSHNGHYPPYRDKPFFRCTGIYHLLVYVHRKNGRGTV